MLSSTICNEFVQLVAKEVTTKIANEITKAKYYSTTVEFTPDVTHVDQLTLTLLLPRSSIDDLVFSVFTSNFSN